jgi:PAS domain S-box-containing protein
MFHHLYDITPYVLNPLAIQTLVVALALMYLGIFGLIGEQGSHVSVVFFTLTSSMSLWLFAFSWMYSAVDMTLAMWWARVAYVGIAFIPAAVYHFSALMLQNLEKVKKKILAAWILSVLFMVLILTTDIQFGSLYHYRWGYYPKSAITSLPFLCYFIAVMLNTLYGFATGYRAGIKGSAQSKRARTLLLAFAAGYFATIDFIASFGIDWYPFGYISIAFFIAISASSIRHYRFMGITPAFAARQIIDTMNDALIVLDPDGVVRLVNQATCNLFGCGAQDLVGKRLTEGMTDNVAFAEKIESIIRNGTVRNIEVDYRTGDSARRVISVSTSVMQNPAGEPLATICVVGDITDRKDAEGEREKLIAQLRDAYEKLQALDKMKSDFISVVSHELRTPLTTIKANAELIIMKPNMTQQRKEKIMSTINSETDRLSRLISDLLDFARIEAGSMKWRVTDVSLEDIIRDAVTSMGPLIENEGLHLTTVFSPPLSPVSADRDRLVQVVTNLLANAVKFTPEGGAIHVAVHQEPAPRAQIVVEISDTGRGIPAGDLEMIFEKFHRSGDELSTTIEGTGLGLAIARQIVEHHGGRIWATSTPGKGSTFTFTLPLAGKDVSAELEQP